MSSSVKSIIAAVAVVAVAVLAFFGLRGNGDTNKSGEEALTVQFVPSQQASEMEAKAKPLGDLLSEELGRPVKVSVSTDYNGIVEALGSEKIDIGFLPPNAYVQAHEQYGAKVLLQTQRYGVNEDGSATDELVDWYKSLILVRKDSGIDSIEDLKGKKIAVQDTTSASGYVYPVAYLLKNGVDVRKDATLVNLKGHDQGILAVQNKDTDAAFVFQDARNIVKGDVPTIFEDTKVLALSEAAPNDTVTARKGLDEKTSAAVQDALIKIAKTEEGHKIVSELYSIEGFAKSNDAKFDVVRETEKAIKD